LPDRLVLKSVRGEPFGKLRTGFEPGTDSCGGKSVRYPLPPSTLLRAGFDRLRANG